MWFEIYREPQSLDECISELVAHAPDVAILAGGTDLIPQFRDRVRTTKTLVNLMAVGELAGIGRGDDGGVVIGATATMRSLMGWDALNGPLTGVREGIESVSSIQVRNVATVGGNACNASPAADTMPALIAADAEVSIAGPAGTRRMALDDFFLGPGRTALQTGEVLVDFRVPPQPPGTGSSFQKHAIRGNSDVSMVCVAARLTLDDDGVTRQARVVLGAVAPTPIRSQGAERALIGRAPDAAAVEEAAAAAVADCRPITDVRAGEAYRREMVRVFTGRAVRSAASRSAGVWGGPS